MIRKPKNPIQTDRRRKYVWLSVWTFSVVYFKFRWGREWTLLQSANKKYPNKGSHLLKKWFQRNIISFLYVGPKITDSDNIGKESCKNEIIILTESQTQRHHLYSWKLLFFVFMKIILWFFLDTLISFA